MSLNKIRTAIKSGGYDKDFELMYQSVQDAKARYLKAVDEFEKLYGDADEINLFSAPGRTEVGGNHTDHQHGRVLAGSVDLDVIAVVSKNNDNVVRIKSEGFRMDTIDLSDLSVNDKEIGRAASLIRGMCAFVKEQGLEVGGFNAYTTSNVLKGSGLSSSAAFEVLIGVILSHLFNGGKIDAVEIAKLAQKSENVYFGKPCGLMDQMACAVGGFVYIDFEDTKNPVIEKIPFDLSGKGYALCIVNTGGNHADLNDDYASVPKEMKSVAAFFGKEYLRQISKDDVLNNISALREKVGDRAILRSIHFFNENERVATQASALKNEDTKAFFKLVKKSGKSSFMYLQNVFTTKNVEEQGLSLALAITDSVLFGKDGAFRVHGGGFAGTIQAFVPFPLVDSYRQAIDSAFGKGACHVLRIRPYGAIKVL